MTCNNWIIYERLPHAIFLYIESQWTTKPSRRVKKYEGLQGIQKQCMPLIINVSNIGQIHALIRFVRANKHVYVCACVCVHWIVHEQNCWRHWCARYLSWRAATANTTSAANEDAAAAAAAATSHSTTNAGQEGGRRTFHIFFYFLWVWESESEPDRRLAAGSTGCLSAFVLRATAHKLNLMWHFYKMFISHISTHPYSMLYNKKYNKQQQRQPEQ